jgi:Chitobiase/beta-hexosaminidase C-terminal domain
MGIYPEFLNHSPQPNFIGIQIDAPIFFRIVDNDGLNLSTLHVTVEGNDALIGEVYQSGFSGVITKENMTPTAVSIAINHTTNWNYGQEINVAAHIEDLLGNVGHDGYKFLTVPNPDIIAPIIAATPHGNVFNSVQSITLNSTEPCTIYYTLDGSQPTLASAVYSAPIIISQEGQTVLKFFGVDTAGLYDVVKTEKYVLDLTAPITTANPSGSNYFNSKEVVLTCNDPTATIYYTTNNANPTTSSTVYSTPIVLPDNKTTTIKFFSVDKAGNAETIKTEVYQIYIAKNNYRIKNVFVNHNYVEHQMELVWDDMYPMFNNIIGYNVYRSDYEFDKYVKLNSNLLSVHQYIDKTLDTQIVNEDVSYQFRRVVNISRQVNDNFNGQHIDSNKWKKSDCIELMFQKDALIFSDKTGLKQESKITSKFKMQGNFDIQIDFDLRQWGIPTSGISACLLRAKRDDQNYVQIGREKSVSSDVYSGYNFVNGNFDLPTITSTVNDFGKFKISRTGNVISIYFYDNVNSTFILFQSYISVIDDLYLEIVGKSADVPIECQWTNFIVNSGAPIIIEPLNAVKEYVIRTSKFPIVDSSGTNKPTDKTSEINVTINGQKAYIKQLMGLEGTIFLETDRAYDEVEKEWFTPPVPDEYSTVLVSYKTKTHTTSVHLRKNYFYKISCVTAEDETDLDLLEPEYMKPEKLNYIWQEAIRRNSWLRDQGGERVLAFIKRKAGKVCSCVLRDIKQRTHVKPDKDCPICYGSGFVGGFYGPIPIIIAPLTAENKINQTERGLKLELQTETWIGNFPLLTQRDMIVRRNGDRMAVGPVTLTEVHGTLTQQNFNIEVIDSTDVRYKFPIQPLEDQFVENTPGIDKDGIRSATVTSAKERENLITVEDKVVQEQVSHENKSVDRQPKGRTITFDNINY